MRYLFDQCITFLHNTVWCVSKYITGYFLNIKHIPAAQGCKIMGELESRISLS